MTPASFSFHDFRLDPADRQLRLNEEAVELSPRYFDALALLVREGGKLVSKDRFLDEVWGGVPVTDEALTQCIKTLRRQLGDQAGSPRFIETVPKHGYRFIAPVTAGERVRPEPEDRPKAAAPPTAGRWRQFGLLGSAGTLGGGAAGLVGGVLYGFATAPGPASQGVGEASALLVMIFLTIVAGLIGGAGVSFGIAAAGRATERKVLWTAAGGAAGGLVVGAFARLIGLDAFRLLFGKAPVDLTGGAEGALLGAVIGLGSWAASRDRQPLQNGMLRAALLGAIAGGLIPLLGGEMMGGSLDLLARQFPGSNIRLDRIGAIFGEAGFGPISQAVTGAIEGALFAGGIVGAMTMARRILGQVPDERGSQP